MWKLENLMTHVNTVSTYKNGKYFPARPLNETKKYSTLKRRIKDAWAVFTCKAEAFIWPEGQ